MEVTFKIYVAIVSETLRTTTGVGRLMSNDGDTAHDRAFKGHKSTSSA